MTAVATVTAGRLAVRTKHTGWPTQSPAQTAPLSTPRARSPGVTPGAVGVARRVLNVDTAHTLLPTTVARASGALRDKDVESKGPPLSLNRLTALARDAHTAVPCTTRVSTRTATSLGHGYTGYAV